MFDEPYTLSNVCTLTHIRSFSMYQQKKHARSYNRDLKIPYPEKRIHSNKKKDQRSLGMTYPYGDYDPTKTIIRNDEPWFDDRGEELKANRCGKISRKKINGYWYMVGSQSNKEWVCMLRS